MQIILELGFLIFFRYIKRENNKGLLRVYRKSNPPIHHLGNARLNKYGYNSQSPTNRAVE